MNKKLLVLALTTAVIIPGYAQDAKTKAGKVESVGDQMYFEVSLEDFETTPYTNKNMAYRVTTYQKGSLAIRDQYPAPTGKSKKYLGVKVFGKYGDVFTIRPSKEIIINKYCKTIAFWVYGKKFSGELSIILQDAAKTNHRMVLGSLDFLGWRKLVIKIDGKINQEDEFLNQKRFLKIMQIQYRPKNRERLPRWQYFYIDDINAMVREKYTDRQSDDW